jgi:hypothetical protein
MVPIAVSCLTAVSVGVPSQSAQAPREARETPAGTAVISGTVLTDDAAPQPVRRARVVLRAQGWGHGWSATTDDQGRFVIAGVSAGRHTLEASRPAWNTTTYGAVRPGRPGTPLSVSEGARIGGLLLRMSRASVMTGLIVDRMGQPMPGVSVTAMKFVYSPATGEKTPQPVTPPVMTDDEGRYRVFGLSPGEYMIGAVFRSGPAIALMELRRLSENEVERSIAGEPGPQRNADTAGGFPAVGHALTYYPGTIDPARAGVITLDASEERSGLNLTIDPVPTATIAPVVSLPENANPASLQIYLLSQQPGGGSGASVMTGRRQADGQIAFPGIAPGSYTIVARAAAGKDPAPARREAVAGLPFYASVPVAMDGEHVQVPVALVPGRTVSGLVSLDGSAAPAAAGAALRLQIVPLASGPALAVQPATVGPDGRFEFRGVPAGRYRLEYAAAKEFDRWLMTSARAGGREVLDDLLDVGEADVSDMAVRFTQAPSELAGRLMTSAGQSAVDYFIIAFSADRSRWTPLSRRVRQARPATDGTFSVRGLPPGEYLIAALTDVQPGEWFDPAFLNALVPAAVKVAIREGERVQQDLKIR